MHNISLILSALLTMALVVVIAPNILAINRGKALHNNAIWLAIFLALALIYRTFGPGGKNEMFQLPQAFSPQNLSPPANDQPATPSDGTKPPEKNL